MVTTAVRTAAVAYTLKTIGGATCAMEREANTSASLLRNGAKRIRSKDAKARRATHLNGFVSTNTMDLFPSLPITKSPKLLWIERHRIRVGFHHLDINGNTWSAFKEFQGEEEIPVEFRRKHFGRGPTEDAALTALALAAGIRLWFEPQD
jgi:hypothetical protein